MAGQYGALARHYDSLMAHVDYERWADFIVPFLDEAGLVLDLACGTGRMTELLCARGFDMIGVDRSEDMLAAAHGRGCGALFLQQDMTELDLYGTVRGAVCTLDGLNYVTEPKALLTVISRVSLFLEKDCPFIFDIHTPGALAARDGKSFTSECDGAFCVWRCEWEAPLCRQEVTLFERRGSLWQRHEEEHTERAYRRDDVEQMLADAGFSEVLCCGDFSRLPPGPDTERMFFVARK